MIDVKSFRIRSETTFFTKEEIRGEGKARPNLEAIDFVPRRLERVLAES